MNTLGIKPINGIKVTFIMLVKKSGGNSSRKKGCTTTNTVYKIRVAAFDIGFWCVRLLYTLQVYMNKYKT